MKTSSRSLKNIAYNSVYRIVVILTPLITAPYLSRVLGADNLGIYSYCYAFALYFSLIPMLGVNDYGNRTIAQTRNTRIQESNNFWQIFYIQFFLTCLTLIIYILSIKFILNNYLLVRLILAIFVLTSAIDINWFAFGLEEFKFTSIRNIIIRIASVLAIFLFVHNQSDLLKYTFIITFGNFLSVIPVWFLVFKNTFFVKPNLKKMFFHLRHDVILFLPVIATTVNQQIDKLMLGHYGYTSEVGYYQNAENIVTLPNFVTLAIVTVMLPYISNLLANGNNHEEANNILYKTCHYASILNLAMMFGLMSISNRFIPWYLGNGYERSAELLIVISPIILINGISSIIRYEYLIPYEKDKVFTSSIILGAVLNIVLNAILIQQYKANGAAIATVFSYLLTLLVQMFFTRKQIRYNRIFIGLIPYFCLACLMALLVHVLDQITMATVFKICLEILVGGLIYIVGCFFIMKITRDDLLEIIKKTRKN